MTYKRTTTRFIYETPPLLESIFEVRYEPSKLDWILPGQFYTAVADIFTHCDSLPPHPSLSLPDPIPRPRTGLLRLYNDARTIVCKLGPGIFSLSAHAPYGGFEEFQRWVSLVWPKFQEVQTDLTPTRLALCNVNQIVLPFGADDEVDLGELLNVGCYLPEQCFSSWTTENLQLNLILDVTQGTKLRLGIQTLSGEKPEIRIEFDCFVVDDLPDLTTLPDWLSMAHDIVGDGFECSLSDEIKQSFGLKTPVNERT